MTAMKVVRMVLMFSHLCLAESMSNNQHCWKRTTSVLRALGWNHIVLVRRPGALLAAIEFAKGGIFSRLAVNRNEPGEDVLAIQGATSDSNVILHHGRPKQTPYLFVGSRITTGTSSENVEFLHYDCNRDLRLQHWFKTIRETQAAPRGLWRVGNSGHYDKIYDLKGSTLLVHLVNWNQWTQVDGCKDNMSVCSVGGILPIVTEQLGRMFNFNATYSTVAGNNFGSVPATGTWSDPNATFGGLLGTAINGVTDVSLCQWLHSYDRDPWADFSIAVKSESNRIVGSAQATNVDTTLFFRPFTLRSWAVILTTFCFMYACYVSLKNRQSENTHNWSALPNTKKVLLFLLFLAFLLLHSYYSGALVMFLATSPPSVPFKSLREALLKYPGWKIVIQNGMQAYIEDEVRPEDSAIVDYWSDIKSPGPVKDHLVPATMKEALEMLGLKKHVVFGEISAIRYVAASIQGFEYQEYTKTRSDPATGTIAFPKGSPLTKMFDKGIIKLTEAGYVDQAIRSFLGRLAKSTTSGQEATEPVALRQVAPVFVILLIILLAVAVIWLCEILVARKRRLDRLLEENEI